MAKPTMASNEDEGSDDEGSIDLTCIEPHPYGVLPGGNVFSLTQQQKSRRQVPLPDDEIFQQVLSFCDGSSLGQLVQTCREWYVAGHQPELWRDAVLREHGETLNAFCNSWKDTYAAIVKPQAPVVHRPMAISGVYSDYYYRTHLCRSFAIPPSWLGPGGSIPRVSESLRSADFLDRFEGPNQPVVLAGAAKSWKAFKKWNNVDFWNSLTEKTFRATSGAAPLPANFTLSAYQAYCQATSLEEAPLYLFDRTALLDGPLKDDFYPDLQRTCPFWDPESSATNGGHDLFQFLGEGRRPDHTWLIMGPKRSGSAFHMDPNATHAWNAAIVGRKRWIFYPPGVTPPGVHPTISGDEVAMPISLGEWLLNYYATEHMSNLWNAPPHERPLECTVEPGDVIFVPHGWWHAVINLDDVNVAITHNYVSRSNLPTVLRFMDKKQDQISGCRDRAESVKPEHLKEELHKAMVKHGHEDWWNEADAIAKEQWICRAWTDEGIDQEAHSATCRRKRKAPGEPKRVVEPSERNIMSRAKKDTTSGTGFSFSFL